MINVRPNLFRWNKCRGAMLDTKVTKITNKLSSLEPWKGAVVVAHRNSICLIIKRQLVRILPGSGLFLSTLFSCLPSSVERPKSGYPRRHISNKINNLKYGSLALPPQIKKRGYRV